MRIQFGGRCAVVFACALMGAGAHAASRDEATGALRDVAVRIDAATRETLAAHAASRAPARKTIDAAKRAKLELETLARTAAKGGFAQDSTYARKQQQVRRVLANLERAQAASRDAALPALIASTDPRRTAHAVPGAAGSTCATALSIAPGDAIETTLAKAGAPGSALWVRIAPTDARFLRLDTLPTPLDTEIALFGATCPADESEAVARNDDALGLAAALTIDAQSERGVRLARIANLGGTGRAVARLQTAGAFVGRITDERDAHPLWADVDTITQEGFFGASTWTDPQTGLYLLSSDPGSYYVYASAAGTTSFNYVAEVYPDAPCPDNWFGNCDYSSATLLTLADGQQIAGIDLALNIGGRIVGTVRDATTGTPIADGTILAIPDDNPAFTYGANTDAAGRFVITGLMTGTYRVEATGAAYGSQLWDHVACGGPVESDCDPAQGTPVAVVRNELVSGIDFDLSHEAHIRATMTPRGGALPAWWTVTLYDVNGNYYGQFGQTDSTQQTIDAGPIAPGTYYAFATSYGFFGQLWNSVDCVTDCASIVTGGTPITLARGDEADITFSLARLSHIAGTITDAATHAPVNNVLVDLISVDPFGIEDVEFTDSAGHYEFATASPGTYWVFATTALYRSTVYPDAPCTSTDFFSCDTSTATPVTTAFGSPDRDDIDIAMPANGTITGHVLLRIPGGMTLAPISPVYENISVYDATGAPISYASTAADGSYVATGIPGGTFHVVATGSGFDQAWSGVDCTPLCGPFDGAPVALVQGQQVADIDFDPVPRALIFGRVTDASGAALPNAAIDLWRGSDGTHCGVAATNADGYYAITSNLDYCPDDHKLSTDVSLPLVNEVYDGILCPDGSAWLGLCSVAGGTNVPFPTTPTFQIANFLLGPRPDPIFADGFER